MDIPRRDFLFDDDKPLLRIVISFVLKIKMMTRNFYLVAAMLFVAGSVASQTRTDIKHKVQNNFSLRSEHTSAPLPPRGGEPAFWEDDFSDPSTWVINNDGQASPFGWGITSTAVGWWSANGINSTSGGNFAELANGDPTLAVGTQAIGVTYTLTTAQSIDVQTLAGTDNVLLTFEQFGARFYDAQTVEISTDGSSFQEVYNNEGFQMLTSTGGSPYPNPNLRVVDIAPAIAGSASTVWIRFKWTSSLPDEVDPNVWVTYGWYIDDVRIVAKDAHDMILDYGIISHNQTGEEYGRVPAGQLYPEMLIGGSIINFGFEDQADANLNVRVLNAQQDELFNDNATVATFDSGDTTALELLVQSSLFELPGRYTVEFEASSEDDTSGTDTYDDNTKARRFGGIL